MKNNCLNRKNISDQIVDVLKERIIKGDYPEGGKLPGENELAEMFGVSRMTARTVFQKMSSLGIVEIRNGEGTFVKKFDFKEYFAQAFTFINEQNTTEDISEFRKYFEPMCNEIASKKRTDKDIEKLTELYNELLESAESDNYMDFVEADYRFHRYICNITNNAVIIMIYELFTNLTEKHYEETLRKFAILNNYSFNRKDENYAIRMSAKLHKEILDGIINSDMSKSNENWLYLTSEYESMPLPDRKWE